VSGNPSVVGLLEALRLGLGGALSDVPGEPLPPEQAVTMTRPKANRRHLRDPTVTVDPPASIVGRRPSVYKSHGLWSGML
jgi:hypothetical protein